MGYETNILVYAGTLPLKRRILMVFFEKYRITKEEYDKWFSERFLSDLSKRG